MRFSFLGLIGPVVLAACLVSATGWAQSTELKVLSPKKSLELKKKSEVPAMFLQADQKTLHPAGTKLLMTDRFTEESDRNWKLEPGWFFSTDQGQGLLKGQGGYKASLESGKEWAFYTMKVRFKLLKGSVRFNVLESDRGRIVLGVGCNRVFLKREQSGRPTFELAERVLSSGYNSWQEITIEVSGRRIRVSLEGRNVLSSYDSSPGLKGGISLESQRDSEVWVDHVTIYQRLRQYETYAATTAAAERISVPRFSLPPPEASVWEVLPNDVLLVDGQETATLADVDTILTTALESAGYTSRAYYPLQRAGRDVRGFALVTRMEQIHEDGIPKKVPHRWAAEVQPLEGFDLARLIQRLFSAEAGFFRIIVFVATPEHFSQGDPISRKAAINWLKKGLNKLPQFIADTEYTSAFNTTALVYQFKKHKGASEDQVEQVKGLLSCREHLRRAGLWEVMNHE